MTHSFLRRTSRYMLLKLRDSIVFLIITLGLFGGGAYLYATWTTMTATQTQAGASVNQVLMDAIRTNLDDLNTRVSATASVPAGAIMAYNLASCPTGWIVANGSNSTPDLRGEFIRGLDSGKGVDSGRVLGSGQDASRITGAGGNPTPTYLLSNNRYTYAYIDSNNQGGNGFIIEHNLEELGSLTTGNSWLMGFSSYANTSYATITYGKVRPRNVALLYCMKQ